jgi:hypothetical protein
MRQLFSHIIRQMDQMSIHEDWRQRAETDNEDMILKSDDLCSTFRLAKSFQYASLIVRDVK